MAQSSWLMSEPQKSEGLKLVGMVVQPSSIETMQIVLSCQSRLSFDPDVIKVVNFRLEFPSLVSRFCDGRQEFASFGVHCSRGLAGCLY
ncbi:hypothetical protein SDJN03_25966, partial [Cucurbita argyrosperma subsp. sororia]